jgi:hypothetical protein
VNATTPQAPIHSHFGPTTTAREVLSGLHLRGVTAVVAGSYSGVGLETTKALANAGAFVVVPARNQTAISDRQLQRTLGRSP